MIAYTRLKKIQYYSQGESEVDETDKAGEHSVPTTRGLFDDQTRPKFQCYFRPLLVRLRVSEHTHTQKKRKRERERGRERERERERERRRRRRREKKDTARRFYITPSLPGFWGPSVSDSRDVARCVFLLAFEKEKKKKKKKKKKITTPVVTRLIPE